MKTHKQLVDEVYRNTSFRGEFMSYAKLQDTLKKERETRPQTPAPSNPPGVNFISYYDLTTSPKVEPDSPLVAKCKWGICFLYSSLFRALSILYKLNAEETRRLISGVADRYSKSSTF